MSTDAQILAGIIKNGGSANDVYVTPMSGKLDLGSPATINSPLNTELYTQTADWNKTHLPVEPTSAKVVDLITESGTTAQHALDTALGYIQTLSQFSIDLKFPDAPSIPVPTINVLPIGKIPPVPADLTPSFPAAPPDPVLAPINAFTIPDAPEFLDRAPTLLDITVPDPVTADLPVAPDLVDVIVPTDINVTLPDVPTLLSLNLPDAPTLNIPLFTDSVGALPSIPDVSFAWSEVEYNTALLSSLNTRLLDLVGGMSTGLTPEVENAIWNRARDRQNELTKTVIDDAAKLVASRGFKAPTGILTRLVQQALQDRANKDSDISREIMIKQAELEQSNFQFSVNSAIQLESQLISNFNQVQNRAFEAAKFTFQSVMMLFDAKINLFNADVSAFGVKVEIFKARLQAELTRLEMYKAQLEGQQIIGMINETQVRIYSAQVAAVQTNVDIFKSRVDAARAQIEAQSEKIDIYRAKLQGFESVIRAKALQFDAYATQIKAEATKVEMFGTKASAFKSQADAYSALVNARLGQQELLFKQYQAFPLEVYTQKINAFQASVAAEASRLSALVNTYSVEVNAFAAVEGAKATNVQSQAEVAKVTTNVDIEHAKLAVQTALGDLQLAVSSHETVQASLRAAGQISGQLAAAALAARNISASISSSDSISDSTSYSNSKSYGEEVSASNSYSNSFSYLDMHTTST